MRHGYLPYKNSVAAVGIHAFGVSLRKKRLTSEAKPAILFGQQAKPLWLLPSGRRPLRVNNGGWGSSLLMRVDGVHACF